MSRGIVTVFIGASRSSCCEAPGGASAICASRSIRIWSTSIPRIVVRPTWRTAGSSPRSAFCRSAGRSPAEFGFQVASEPHGSGLSSNTSGELWISTSSRLGR